MEVMSTSLTGFARDQSRPPGLDVFATYRQPDDTNTCSVAPVRKRKRSMGEMSTADQPGKHGQTHGADDCLPVWPGQRDTESVIMSLPRHAANPDTFLPGSASLDTSRPATPDASVKRVRVDSMKPLRQTLSAQISLEILLKHKELRLIDQEMAKCQVALEQLRRCHEIPFPQAPTGAQDVTSGRVTSVTNPHGRRSAPSPAQGGVADGPYTRHYAQWLLPDCTFDGGEPGPLSAASHTTAASFSGRSTRGVHVDVSAASKSRSGRASHLQSLPAGYAQPREKATGPMILKRKSDGKSVKLVCPDCRRHDFGSAQGFINHCRIGHQRSFASHDAAAEACGEPVELDSTGAVKGLLPVATSTPTPTPTSASTSTSTPTPVLSMAKTTVHPLVSSAKLSATAAANLQFLTDRFPETPRQPALSRVVAAPLATAAPSGPPEVPYLTALAEQRDLGTLLHDLVAESKLKVDLDADDDRADDEHGDVNSPTLGRSPDRAQASCSKRLVRSRPGVGASTLLHSAMRMPAVAHDGPHAAQYAHVDLTAASPASLHGLLPSPTNESTQAPSLVDDDEDFDAQSPASTDPSDPSEMSEPELEFEVHDDEHGERLGQLKPQDLVPAPTTTCVSPEPRVTEPNLSRRPLGNPLDSRRNVFASPSPAPEASTSAARELA